MAIIGNPASGEQLDPTDEVLANGYISMTYRGLEDNDNDEGSRNRTEDPESLQTQPAMLAMRATLTTLRVLKTWLEPGGARTLTPPPKAPRPHEAFYKLFFRNAMRQP